MDHSDLDYFRDSRGTTWKRDINGVLAEVETATPYPVIRDTFWRVKPDPSLGPTVEIQILMPKPLEADDLS